MLRFEGWYFNFEKRQFLPRKVFDCGAGKKRGKSSGTSHVKKGVIQEFGA
jgi:hypothetical protein